jgi:hypothetical protein
MDDLAAVGRRIVAHVETFLRVEALEVDEDLLPFLLRSAAKTVEVRLRSGFGARPHFPQGSRAPRPKPAFDPAARAVVHRCLLGCAVIARDAEG